MKDFAASSRWGSRQHVTCRVSGLSLLPVLIEQNSALGTVRLATLCLRMRNAWPNCAISYRV